MNIKFKSKEYKIKYKAIFGKLNYKSDLWVIDTQYNILDSNQDNAASIKREEFSLTSKRFLYNQWYAYANYSYLLSTEQGIESRQNPNFGSSISTTAMA